MNPAATSIEPGTQLAIERLIHLHAWLIDHGRAAEVADLYTQDARVLGIGPDKVGRTAIAEWAATREAMKDRRSRHLQTNIVLEPVAADEMRGTVALALYRHDGEGAGSPSPLLVGEYADVYRRGPDGSWRFAERHLAVLFGQA